MSEVEERDVRQCGRCVLNSLCRQFHHVIISKKGSLECTLSLGNVLLVFDRNCVTLIR